MTSARAHASALLAALNASLGSMSTPRSAYEYEDAPTAGSYVLFSLSRRFGGNERAGRISAPTGWRVTVRAVSDADVNSARVLLDRATAALEDKNLVIEGKATTPIAFETEEPIGQDDSNWTGLRAFTYAH